MYNLFKSNMMNLTHICLGIYNLDWVKIGTRRQQMLDGGERPDLGPSPGGGPRAPPLLRAAS